MRQNQHIIQKLLVDITLNTANGNASQHSLLEKLREWVEQVFLSKLEAAFDDMNLPPNLTLRLAHLELDLGQFSELRLGQLTESSVQQLVQKEIGRILEEGPSSMGECQVGLAERAVEALNFFLENGRLPWWLNPVPNSMKTWEQSLIQTIIHRDFDHGKLVATLRQTASRQRLAVHFSSATILKILEAVFAGQTPELTEIQKFAAIFFEKEVVKTSLLYRNEAQTWEAVLAWLSAPIKQGKLLDFVIDQLHGLNKKQDEKELETQSAIETSATEEIYIRNAGLVLLHPFLQMFFENLKVAKNGQITKPKKALQLLHFLVTGRTPGPEYDLVLNKLLCGLSLSAFVPAKTRLTKKEKNECETLLKAVIGNWSALGDTSPEGLRGTFLWRDGKLSRKQDGSWLLQVNQKTVDILIERLPWGLGIVKLPWMPEILWVEWA